MIAGALGPPALYLVLRKFGYAVSVSLLLGAALTVCETAIVYSGHVKSYTADVLVILLLCVVLPWLARQQWRVRTAVVWTVGSIVLASFSPFTLLAVIAAAAILVLHAQRRPQDSADRGRDPGHRPCRRVHGRERHAQPSCRRPILQGSRRVHPAVPQPGDLGTRRLAPTFFTSPTSFRAVLPGSVPCAWCSPWLACISSLEVVPWQWSGASSSSWSDSLSSARWRPSSRSGLRAERFG